MEKICHVGKSSIKSLFFLPMVCIGKAVRVDPQPESQSQSKSQCLCSCYSIPKRRLNLRNLAMPKPQLNNRKEIEMVMMMTNMVASISTLSEMRVHGRDESVGLGDVQLLLNQCCWKIAFRLGHSVPAPTMPAKPIMRVPPTGQGVVLLLDLILRYAW